jgi:hypothetical protein
MPKPCLAYQDGSTIRAAILAQDLYEHGDLRAACDKSVSRWVCCQLLQPDQLLLTASRGGGVASLQQTSTSSTNNPNHSY